MTYAPGTPVIIAPNAIPATVVGRCNPTWFWVQPQDAPKMVVYVMRLKEAPKPKARPLDPGLCGYLASFDPAPEKGVAGE